MGIYVSYFNCFYSSIYFTRNLTPVLLLIDNLGYSVMSYVIFCVCVCLCVRAVPAPMKNLSWPHAILLPAQLYSLNGCFFFIPPAQPAKFLSDCLIKIPFLDLVTKSDWADPEWTATASMRAELRSCNCSFSLTR